MILIYRKKGGYPKETSWYFEELNSKEEEIDRVLEATDPGQAAAGEVDWRNPDSPRIMLEPLACIIILSVRAAQHAAETNRRSADHFAREHPRS